MLWVGQFGIVEGQPREDSPFVGVFAEDGRAEGEDALDLFVLVEPARPGSEDACLDLAESIGASFRERRLSLSGGILRALQAAHEELREWNRKSLKEHRAGAGVSCLARRGAVSYLGQVAPAACVILRAGALVRLAPELPDALEPLGLHDEFWPEFSRHELGEGDRALLLSPDLSAALSDEELGEALALEPDETLPAIYRRAKGLPRCAALLVAMLETRNS
jgi:hypothetical protein